MGNETSQSQKPKAVKFGNVFRDDKWFKKKGVIDGEIVAVHEIIENEVVVVVNKILNYGVRLFVYDPRYFKSAVKFEDNQNHYEVIPLTNWTGIVKNEVPEHIATIRSCFTGDKHKDAPWDLLRKKYKNIPKIAPFRRVEVQVVDEKTNNPSEYQRNLVIQSLIPGDIIIIERIKGIAIKYYHYCVYIGNNQVLNIRHKSKGGGAAEESFDTVAGGSTKKVWIEYKLIAMTSPQSILAQAEAILIAADETGKRLYEKEYNLFTKNCEHFARGLIEAGECNIQKPDFDANDSGRSTQVEEVVNVAAGIAGVAVSAAAMIIRR